MKSGSSKAKKTRFDTVKTIDAKAGTKCKKFKASKHQHTSLEPTRTTKYEPTPQSLPERIKKTYDKKHADNYSESEQKRRQEKKVEFGNKVGWMERKGRHRHAHQERREKEFINFMHGLPLDYDIDSD